jgi:quercetin dioxygenase-like cupin family protein
LTAAITMVVGFLALSLQTPTPAASPKPPASPPAASAAQTQSTARPGALVLTVMSEKGEPLAGAQVAAHGATVDRSGTTGPDGTLTLQNMPVGTYRCRITKDGFITLEKEVAVKTAARSTAEASLSVAPAPPPPPAPSPTPVVEKPSAPMGTPGQSKVLSIPELAETMLKDSQPVVDRALGCSGVVSSTLLTARDNIAAHRHADMDEVIYVVAGDATLTINDKDQSITAGWFGLVPRGASHAVTRKGRNPIVLLLVQSGKPCAPAPAARF